MEIGFLTPLGALLAAGVLLPLLALVGVSSRAARLREALGLARLARRRLVAPVLAASGAAALVGLAAAQPVLERTVPQRVRTDAEAYVVLDISRSMLAREEPGAATRFARAKAVAAQVRAGLPGVPVGLASLTDRVLPHVFPSADEDVFAAALADSIAIERPPPRSSFLSRATSFDALAEIATRRYFSPAARHRLVVVLSDGESEPVTAARVGRLFGRSPAIQTLFVHFWDEGERVFTRGASEPQYRPDPNARTILDGLAVATGGQVFGEREGAAATEAARQALGTGPTQVEGRRRDPVALAPLFAAGAFLPLGLLLWRRDR
ncbi:MAG: VWA domain-containing protein [Gaiellaceae bacterium]